MNTYHQADIMDGYGAVDFLSKELLLQIPFTFSAKLLLAVFRFHTKP